MKEMEDILKKAKRFLSTAELALNDGDYDSCVSRCYYAMFLLVLRLLKMRLKADGKRLEILLRK